MGLKHFLHRWWNTTPLSFRPMYSITYVEVAGFMGKGSHLKYLMQVISREIWHPANTDTYQVLLAGKPAVQFGWDVHRRQWHGKTEPIENLSRTTGKNPCQGHTAHSSQLCFLLVPRCHLWVPVRQHRYTSTALQLKPFSVLVRIVFSWNNKWDQLPVQLHKHQSQDKGRERESLSAAVSLSSQFSLLR